MKYSYTFRIIHINNNTKFLTIDLPKEIELVTTFLHADVQSDGHLFLEAIDKVLNGQEANQEFGGNVCILQIKQDITTVLDSLSDDGIGNSCDIETAELKELILLWVKENKKFLD